MEHNELNMQVGPDLDAIFEMLKDKMPLPDPMKEGVLNAFVYVLSM